MTYTRLVLTLRFCLLACLLTSLGQAQDKPMYLSGHVVLEDGSPPPEAARIELICNGQIQPQALTHPDGSFNFRVGGDRAREIHAGSSDRSQPGAAVGAPAPPARGGGSVGGSMRNPSFVNMSSCEVRAVLAGFQSSTVKLGRRSVFESPDIGTLVLYRVGEKQGAVVSASSLSAPEKAMKAYEKGEKALLQEKPDPKKASKELQKAVEEYPEFAAAWNLLGEARIRLDDLEGAHEALEKAIESDPQFAPPCVTLALLELKQGNVEAAAVASGKAIELAPELAEAQFYHGMAQASLGNPDKAEASLRAVLKSPDANRFPRSHYLLGVVLAQKGQVEEAVSHFNSYLELEPDSRAADSVRDQLVQWKASGLIQ